MALPSACPLPQPAAPVPAARPPRSSSKASPSPKAASPAPSGRARSRALPLIEARPDGSYTVISPTHGALDLVPDSPAWFDWLASIEAFCFQGQQGHYSATRKFRHSQRIQSWNVHRSCHGRSCTLYLGLTPSLTRARLEQIAATVTERLSAH